MNRPWSKQQHPRDPFTMFPMNLQSSWGTRGWWSWPIRVKTPPCGGGRVALLILRFFGHCDRVFWPISFKLGGDMDMAEAHRTMWNKTSWRNNVATLWRKNVKIGGFLAIVAVFFDRFASNLAYTLLWDRCVVSCEKNVMALETPRRNDVINIGLKVGPSEPRGFCDWFFIIHL